MSDVTAASIEHGTLLSPSYWGHFSMESWRQALGLQGAQHKVQRHENELEEISNRLPLNIQASA